jgi:hypothetical protein
MATNIAEANRDRIEKRVREDIEAIEKRIELPLPRLKTLISKMSIEELLEIFHVVDVTASLIDTEEKFGTGVLTLKDFTIWRGTTKERLKRRNTKSA